jgi:DNA/RNA-binding domain of Phe-tRNA-synthetase-like protein
VISEPETRRGWVAPELAAEFPHVGLRYTLVEAGSGASPPEVKERLRALSDRYMGGRAVQLRQEPIPWAYRVFFRQVGIDPDERRTPPEEAALERMRAGSFKSRNLLDDALVIATVETGVGLVAFDADVVEGRIGLRLSQERERLGGDGRPLSHRQIVIADAQRSLGVLFGDLAEERGVHPATRRMLVCAVQVKGIPEVSLDEALWTVFEVVTGGAATP